MTRQLHPRPYRDRGRGRPRRPALATRLTMGLAMGLAMGLGLGPGLVGCAATIHPADAPIDLDRPVAEAEAEAMVVAPKQVHRLARRRIAQYTRRIRPAHNVDIVATLWDPALLAVDPVARGRATSAGLGEDPGDATARLERWRDRYVRAQTSFTVVVELANRPGPDPRRLRHGGDAGQFEDPLVAPKAWSFQLELPGGETLAPSKIEVQGVDRFPTRAGGHHYRIAYAVHFPGELGDSLGPEASDGERIKLRVRPLIESPRAVGFGGAASRKGFVIAWWVRPAASLPR